MEQVRAQELAGLRDMKYLDAACVYFWAATQLLFSVMTFGLVALMGQPLRCALGRQCMVPSGCGCRTAPAHQRWSKPAAD